MNLHVMPDAHRIGRPVRWAVALTAATLIFPAVAASADTFNNNTAGGTSSDQYNSGGGSGYQPRRGGCSEQDAVSARPWRLGNAPEVKLSDGEIRAYLSDPGASRYYCTDASCGVICWDSTEPARAPTAALPTTTTTTTPLLKGNINEAGVDWDSWIPIWFSTVDKEVNRVVAEHFTNQNDKFRYKCEIAFRLGRDARSGRFVVAAAVVKRGEGTNSVGLRNYCNSLINQFKTMSNTGKVPAFPRGTQCVTLTRTAVFTYGEGAEPKMGDAPQEVTPPNC